MSVIPTQARYTIQLMKCPVTEIKPIAEGARITIKFNTLYPSFVVPFKPDLNPGDFLTIYTEIERDENKDKID